MMRDLSRLLRPRSIAVIGGGLVCRYVMENCEKIGFDGPVWHIHPSRGAFARLEELPAAPDVAFIGINRAATLEAVAALSAMGAGGAVAYASGFLEAQAELGDGADMQAQLLNAAGDMPLIGPNCYGFLNYLDGAALWPDQQGGRACDGGVAIITQSSNIAINLTMQKRGLPVAYLVTAGNQAQLGLAEIGEALLGDARVTALGLHIEGIGDIAALEALAGAARRLGKPIVALKAGRSDHARAATLSHTASLAGSAAGAYALLARLGIAQVNSLSVMLETLKLLHVSGPLKSNRIASMSCSGGEASLMADLAVGRDLEFPPLQPKQSAALRAALGPRVALANPLDYHTYIWTDEPAMRAAYSAMMLGDLALGAVVADFPRADRCADADWEPVIAAVDAAGQTSGTPMAIVSLLPENISEPTSERLLAMGIAPLHGMDEALRAIEAAAWLGRGDDAPAPVAVPGQPVNIVMLSEADGKAALAAKGLIIPRSRRVERATLRAAASGLAFPLVLKGEGIAHKTEARAVALDLNDADAVERAACAMATESFLLEEMIGGGVAELLVGVVRDGAHGFVLTLAAGGTLTEILRDRASLVLPVRRADIDAALDSLRIAALLAGYRGAPRADRDATVRAVLAVQAYVLENRARIEEVEVNPLVCTPDGAVAADVLIRIGEAEP